MRQRSARLPHLPPPPPAYTHTHTHSTTKYQAATLGPCCIVVPQERSLHRPAWGSEVACCIGIAPNRPNSGQAWPRTSCGRVRLRFGDTSGSDNRPTSPQILLDSWPDSTLPQLGRHWARSCQLRPTLARIRAASNSSADSINCGAMSIHCGPARRQNRGMLTGSELTSEARSNDGQRNTPERARRQAEQRPQKG